jgi:hypothetical protein
MSYMGLVEIVAVLVVLALVLTLIAYGLWWLVSSFSRS